MGDDLDVLRSATQELGELRDQILQRIITAEEGRNAKPLEHVQNWVLRAGVKLAEADELIKESQQLEKDCLGWLNCCSSSRFGRMVELALEEVVDLKNQGDFKEVAETEITEAKAEVERPYQSVMYFNSMLDKVWYFLEIEDRMGIIGIHGLGGVGKTTLLTQIKNSFRRERPDYTVIWVLVAKGLRLDKIQEEIAARLGLSNDEQWDTKTFDEKALYISQVMQKMKFVLMLDDIWKRVELEEIGVHLSLRNKSKIIFTTRFEEVCDEMKAEKKFEMEPLSWEKSWELFQENARIHMFNDDPEIPVIAKDVARECCGLPLSLITIGRAMSKRKRPQEWRHAVEILSKPSSYLQGMGNEAFAIFKFNYDSLPSYKVKSCFLYCCLFSEHFKILKSDLVEYWICENFWEKDDNQVDAFNEGYNIIDTLVYACLLEEEGDFVKMHDVIRDMALWIACEIEKGKENYVVQTRRIEFINAPESETWTEVRRLSLMENGIQELTEVPQCPHLLTLLLCFNRSLSVITGDFFQYLKMLTVLDLSNTGLRVLPAGISNLVSLQYLNLSRTRINELTSELLELKRLKCLNLENMFLLCWIPRHMIYNLPVLQVLRMSGSGLICSVEDEGDINVEEMEGLEHLKALSITINQAIVFDRIFKSEKLLRCIKSLHISEIMESKFFNLGDEEVNADSIIQESKTRVPGDCFCSANMRNKCFNNLQSVYIYLCPHLEDLTWLVLAPNLTGLHVWECGKLQEIISLEKMGKNQKNPFARLEVLELLDLEQLKRICRKQFRLDYLEEITVVNCPLLEYIPASKATRRRVVV